MTRLPPPFTPHTPLPLSRLSEILSSLFSVPSFFFFFLSEIHRKETRWHRVRKEKSCGANNTMSSLPVSPVLLRATLRGHTSACFVGLVVKRRSLLTSKLLHLCGNKKKTQILVNTLYFREQNNIFCFVYPCRIYSFWLLMMIIMKCYWGNETMFYTITSYINQLIYQSLYIS